VNASNNYDFETAGIIINAAAGKYNSASWNKSYGLNLTSKGVITINRVHADNNVYYGSNIENNTADSDKAVTTTKIMG
jgi:hypothetical protein